ncbi:class I adenylate-forming enzyme family protein [Nocardioides sp. GXQ0305]|uniref:class I adenylate-forming enzyme family protein n=1 Tax=Nocardioides sp. GXQ0305 TaxID=3423912 RepID=UPI003D7CFE8E
MPELPDVARLVSSAAAERPDAVALVAAGERLTWAGLEDEVARLATGLGRVGVVAGQRVLIALGNRPELVTTYLGVLRAQAVAVPVNPASTSGELARMLADSGARLAVADATTLPAVRAATDTVAQARAGHSTELDDDLVRRSVPGRVVVVGEEPGPGELGLADLRADDTQPVPALPDPDKLAALLYTSGTSGRPRAAMLTHRALSANLEQVAAVEPPMMHADDVVLGVLPLFHVYGLNAVLGGVLRHGCTLVLAERFDPQQTLDLVEDEGCTVLPLAPAVFAHWREEPRLRERLAPVRLVLSGSAPLAADTIDDFTARTGIPLHQGYGLTEAAPVVTSTLCSERLQPGSVGAALPGIEIRLVDTGGVAPEVEDAGEIEVRGPNLFSGYWPDGSGGPDADGWWATGDVGFLDDSGDLFLVDRVKELVVVSGFNVYPVEVEEVLAEVDGVAEVAVIGVPDELTGEAVVAYVRAPGADPALIADAVRERCVERLARFKQPSRIEVVDELPLTVTGKVQKGRLRGLERRRVLGLLE